ncbi:ABC transporter ATP-binding protein [Paenibacillus sp. MMS18-CY102]|uniref:ABC transporter ATP-binding protein n=1 Tax=Paenibacillus sp. MMS18-CY102 TaxID=2682849 RepID=UPI001366295B|nr:ATP-binding cassette domain-containing protein [Paenibacillus sp. MMS18-CY102]MWC30576.1 ATP-binding cassette domain-containing protein [Paenibacillus sp. MMS18-CY102]
MSIIEVTSLTKEYKQYKRYSGFFGAFKSLVTTEHTIKRAVQDISFKLDVGEAIGYLGPNGAGKSTMIKMLTGILVPTSGELRVCGQVPYMNRKEIARRMGVVFGQRSQLWWDLPVKDSFDLSKDIYKIPKHKYGANLEFCKELLDMGEFLDRPVRQLSLGQRMRAEVAIALLHEPDILFLDEPTIGLDVLAKDRIRTFLRTVNREKKTSILLTTHDLQDIEEICQRMLIVNEGKVIFDGQVQELKEKLGNEKTVTLKFAKDPGPLSLQGGTLLLDDGKVKKFMVPRKQASSLQLFTELTAKYEIEDISIVEPDIEQVIRILYASLKESSVINNSAGEIL